MAKQRVKSFFNDLNHVVLSGVIVQEPKRDGYLVKDSWSLLLSVADGIARRFTVRVIFVSALPYQRIGGMKCLISGRLFFKTGEMFVVGDDMAVYDAFGRKRRTDGLDW